jgi:hypothetical protein
VRDVGALAGGQRGRRMANEATIEDLAVVHDLSLAAGIKGSK